MLLKSECRFSPTSSAGGTWYRTSYMLMKNVLRIGLSLGVLSVFAQLTGCVVYPPRVVFPSVEIGYPSHHHDHHEHQENDDDDD